MEIHPKNHSMEEIQALEEKLERLRNEERIIQRNTDEFYALIRSEPYNKERMTRKIEDEDLEMDRVRLEIKKASKELSRLKGEAVEPDAGIEETEAFYPNKNFHTYKKYHFKCRKCGWEGLGADTVIVGDEINCEVIGCPECRWLIEFIPFPTTQEVLQYGTAADKKKARGWLEKEKQFDEKREERWKKHPDLTSPDQLPDIDAEEIIISLREEGIGKSNAKDDIWENAFLVFYWGEREIWRVPVGFEYYRSYLRWGEILKEKYGERLVDFEAKETVDLGGDSLSAFKKVRELRNSLAKKET